jgi:hypothetical protein
LLAPAEAPDKFLDCAKRVITEHAARSVIQTVDTLERQTDLGPLFEILGGRAGGTGPV